jgi:CDP-6-deoxy-D-xylo-4-hexulose-3-dehydrase
MVVTDDFDLYQVMLSLRSHGWSRDLDDGVRADLVAKHGTDPFRDLYTFYYPGFNFRSTDLQAHIGLTQLRQIDFISERRQVNHTKYESLLGNFWTQRSDTSRLSSFWHDPIF